MFVITDIVITVFHCNCLFEESEKISNHYNFVDRDMIWRCVDFYVTYKHLQYNVQKQSYHLKWRICNWERKTTFYSHCFSFNIFFGQFWFYSHFLCTSNLRIFLSNFNVQLALYMSLRKATWHTHFNAMIISWSVSILQT